MDYQQIKKQVDEPIDDIKSLKSVVNELEGRIISGDLHIGLLPPEAEDTLLLGFLKIAEFGGDEERLQFTRKVMNSEYSPYAEKAYEYAKTLAKNDTTGEANLLCGYFTFRGFGTERNLETSYQYHLKSAELGNSDAMFELAIYHDQGLGIEHDAELADKWLEKAAAKGHNRAQYNLGSRFARNGNSAKAAEYYQQAADGDNPKAAATLAIMLLNGELPKDVERAQELVHGAFELGFPTDDFFEQVGLDPSEHGIKTEL